MIQGLLFPELEPVPRGPAPEPRRPLRLVVLGSGSQGNAVVIEATIHVERDGQKKIVRHREMLEIRGGKITYSSISYDIKNFVRKA